MGRLGGEGSSKRRTRKKGRETGNKEAGNTPEEYNQHLLSIKKGTTNNYMSPQLNHSPAMCSGMMMGSSFSSETRIAQACELYSEFTNISLDSTSSFFCSSPVEFMLPPAIPSMHEESLKIRPCKQTNRRATKELTQASNTSLSHGSGDELASSLDGTQ